MITYRGFRIILVGPAYRIRRLGSDLDCGQFGSLTFKSVDAAKFALDLFAR
jgi:hypothetical protein